MNNVNPQDDFKIAKQEPEENKDLNQTNKKESENSLDKVELMTTNFLFSLMFFSIYLSLFMFIECCAVNYLKLKLSFSFM